MPNNPPLPSVRPPLDAKQTGARVFAGELLLFPPAPAIKKLLARVRQIARESFSCAHPPHAHRIYSRAEFLRRAETAQKRVNSPECKPLFAEVLAENGIAADGLFWDTLGLRVAPPVKNAADFNKRGFRSHVAAHRDTWGAGFQAQINWWAPVWPLAARRTIGFYFSYWTRPLPNTTAEWSFKEFLESRKKSADGRAAKYPSAPQSKTPPDETPLPVLIKPGELLCFSSAHLHASVFNKTPLTRFSLEIRTLHLEDLQRGRGAPNVDNESRQPLLGLYSSVKNGAPLKEYWRPQ
ncbi:MAG: hypothetical protein HAW59_05935 [Betaproteobacteria bacterium]|nr:hypothetical protein [Betaproteobacteria bacterium]